MDEFRVKPSINEVSLDGFQIVPGMMFNRAIDPTMRSGMAVLPLTTSALRHSMTVLLFRFG